MFKLTKIDESGTKKAYDFVNKKWNGMNFWFSFDEEVTVDRVRKMVAKGYTVELPEEYQEDFFQAPMLYIPRDDRQYLDEILGWLGYTKETFAAKRNEILGK